MVIRRVAMVAAVVLSLGGAPALAAEGGRLDLTLAGAEPVAGANGPACRLSFLAENGLGADLVALVLEAVIFTRDGSVERLLLLDFRAAALGGRPCARLFGACAARRARGGRRRRGGRGRASGR